MSSNYTMPVCIPDCPLDFLQATPARPSNWTTEVPGYYFINSITGSSSAAFGTPDAPRKNIPGTIPAGSYIEVQGLYTQHSGTNAYVFTVQGTDAAFVANTSGPAWITSSPDATGTLTRHNFVFQGANLIITDITATKNAKVQINSSSPGRAFTNFILRNSKIHDMDTSPVVIDGSATDATLNVVIYNNKLYDCGDVFSVTDDDVTGIQVQSNVHNVWILENEIYSVSGTGIQIIGKGTNDIYIGKNLIYQARQTGVGVKYGARIVVSQNRIRDIISTPWSPSKGVVTQYQPDEFWIINNHISGVEYGIRVASTDTTEWIQKIYAIGNIIHDVYPMQEGAKVGPIETTSSWQTAGIHIAGGHEYYIYNNLIFDAPNGIDSSSRKLIEIKNNIILDVTREHAPGATGYHIMLELAALGETATVDGNYFGDNMNVLIREGVTRRSHATVESLNSVGGATGNVQGTNIITPANIDSIIKNLSVSGLGFSELIDAGVNSDDLLYTRYIGQFPETAGVDRDIFGMVRKQGTGIDIGPFEQGGVFAPALPNKPNDIYLDVTDKELVWTGNSPNSEFIVYRDGVDISGVLPVGTSVFTIPTAGQSRNIYRVDATNDTGTVSSNPVTSDIVSITPVADSLILELPSTRSWIHPRTDASNEGDLVIGGIINSTTLYGTNYSKTSFTIAGSSPARGYVYSVGNLGESIRGGVLGTGNVDIAVVNNNYGDNEAVFKFRINDTVFLMNNAGGFSQSVVNVDFVNTLEFTYSALTDNSKSILGIGAIIEK